MHAFSPRCRSWWFPRAFSRNPLLRGTDRIEACVILFAILVALAATPVCVVAGVGVYRSHAQLYAAQSRTRHAVTATVVDVGPRLHKPHTTCKDARVIWLVGSGGARGGEVETAHTDWVGTDHSVKLGDRIAIWVDDVGASATPPTPLSQAGLDAVGIGAGIWLVVMLGLMAVVGMVRSPLNRIRQVQWEREIKGFADGGTSYRPH